MKYFLLILFALTTSQTYAQFDYAASAKIPFGALNPESPSQVGDYESLIGVSECVSIRRAPNGNWNDEVPMTWTFKYILNGTAVQDNTLKEDNTHSGSIRQFNPDSSAWYVHFFSSAASPNTLPTWKGNTSNNGDIILYKKQLAPNGQKGYYRLTFFDITTNSFNWVGEWVNENESIVYPTWKINCTKIQS